MELFVTWTLAFAVIILVILLGKSYQTNKELVKNNDCRKENYKLLQEESYIIKSILLKVNKICMDSTKPIDRKTIPILALQSVYYTHKENGNIEGLDLTSIRFKNTQDGVLVYLNGAMVPFIGDIICSPIELQNIDKIEALYRLSTIFDRKDNNIKFTIQALHTILDNLNK